MKISLNTFLTSFLLLVAIFSLPLPVFAAPSCGGSFGTPQNFSEFLCIFVDIVSLLIPIVAAVALLAFFWGLAKFILHSDSDDAHENGRQLMFWGIIALFVMVSIWGIITILHDDFFRGGVFIPQLPTSF
jgi:hypothetical protein